MGFTTKRMMDVMLLEGLTAMRKQRKASDCGICWSLDLWQADQPKYAETRLCSLHLTHWARKWPKYSGWENYPVPSPALDETPCAVFYRSCMVRGGMWGKKNPYGALRWELLEFMIAELKAHLAKHAKRKEINP